MTIEHNGIAYTLTVDQERAIETAAQHASHRLVVVRGCERCRIVCILGVMDCNCCAIYTSRSGYPSDGKGHVTLLSIVEFTARLRLDRRVFGGAVA